MSDMPPRMRMFAGPNGSGKSVLKSYLPPALLGVYLNADEIEAVVRHQGGINLQSLGVETVAEEVLPFLTKSRLLLEHGATESAQRLRFADGNWISATCLWIRILRPPSQTSCEPSCWNGMIHSPLKR
ncbi:MAG: hypothetical protein WCG76_04350 [Verrucomicrobiota bacterium]